MRNKLAKVKNVLNFSSAYNSLMRRDAGVPGMGLVYGFTGAGKSTAIAWMLNQVNGVFVRASAMWTPSAMMGAILAELGAAPLNSCSKMMGIAVERLALQNRPLFVDEADYLLGNLKMLESLRDIHDITGVPVVLIGMAGIEKRLVHRQQLSRRISQWVEFLPCDLDDTTLLAETVCEVSIAPDLLRSVHQQSGGSIGLMTVGLSRIEAFAKTQRWESIDADQWGGRQLFLPRPGNGNGVR